GSLTFSLPAWLIQPIPVLVLFIAEPYTMLTGLDDQPRPRIVAAAVTTADGLNFLGQPDRHMLVPTHPRTDLIREHTDRTRARVDRIVRVLVPLAVSRYRPLGHSSAPTAIRDPIGSPYTVTSR